MKVAILTMFNGLSKTYSLVNVVAEHLKMLLDADIETKMLVSEDETITLYFGEGVTEEDAQSLCDELSYEYPDVDIDFHQGGQPLYHYILSIE